MMRYGLSPRMALRSRARRMRLQLQKLNESGAELLIEDSSEQRLRSFKGAIGFKEATMTVRAILDSKGHQIQSVEPDAKLSAAIKVLAERKIGAVLAMSKGHIEGILSERDIVRVLGERGAAVLDEPVSAVMTRKVVSCKQADTVAAIMEMMTSGKFRHLPVTEEGRVVGLISIGDIVKWRVREYEAEQEALREYIKTARIKPAIRATCPPPRPARECESL